MDFVDMYETRKRHVMQETPQVWQYHRTIPGMEEKIPLSLWTTWEMSLPLLDNSGGHKTKLADVLTLCILQPCQHQ